MRIIDWCMHHQVLEWTVSFSLTVRNTLDTKTEHQRRGMGMGMHTEARRKWRYRGHYTTQLNSIFGFRF